MKIRLVLALAGLALSFVWPTLAQEANTASPRRAQRRELEGDPKALDEFAVLATKQSDAFTNKDAAALAALFTEDAVLVAPDGIFAGRHAIEKRDRCGGHFGHCPRGDVSVESGLVRGG